MRARLLSGAAVVVALSGCAATVPPDDDHTAARTARSGWGDDLTTFREQATTELERRILADGVVSDEERVAAEDAFVQCAESSGFRVTDFQAGGGYSIDGPFAEDGPPALAACEASFNRTSGMYWQMQRNPAGEDEAQLMTSCLIRAGLVDESYTSDAYMRDVGSPPLTVASREFSACNAEPTTAFTR